MTFPFLGAIPDNPFNPVPLKRFKMKVSTLSLAVCPVAIFAAPLTSAASFRSFNLNFLAPSWNESLFS
ncbi:MAG: hypothetical protein BWY60_00591 [Actinobacteria bacterium ADurb.Bin346]|nr:MAG: hypothetical protein BWY60_00591 [Actinobacteria bacterium ADurb.Bin346]